MLPGLAIWARSLNISRLNAKLGNRRTTPDLADHGRQAKIQQGLLDDLLFVVNLLRRKSENGAFLQHIRAR
jgi:hypothetical protein